MASSVSQRMKLGELLLKAGVITEQQLRQALAEQKKWGGKLGALLVDLGFLDEDMLVKALSKQLGLPRVDFSGLVVSPEALGRLKAEYALDKHVLPIAIDGAGKTLIVVLADPTNRALVDEIARVSGCRVQVAIAGERALDRAIRQYYSDVAGVNRAAAGQAAAGGDEPDSLESLCQQLEQMQRDQVGILKSLVEMLLQKGYISREEYRWVLRESQGD